MDIFLHALGTKIIFAAPACTLEGDCGYPLDFQIAAGSVPRYVRPNEASFPDRRSYLVPAPDRAAHWQETLGKLGPGS